MYNARPLRGKMKGVIKKELIGINGFKMVLKAFKKILK